MAMNLALSLSRVALSSSKNVLVPRNLFVCIQKENISNRAISKLGLPEKPKRPMTPFFQYMSLNRPKVLEKGVKNNIDIIRVLSKEWKNVDEETKKVLHSKYEHQMIDYIKNMIKYEQSLTHQQRDAINNFKEQEKELIQKKAQRKKIKSLNRPKKPVNSFLLFTKGELRFKDPNQSHTDWMTLMSKKWNSLSVEKKQQYAKECKVLYEKYEKELSAWEENMIRLGHTDVVRHKSSIESKKQK